MTNRLLPALPPPTTPYFNDSLHHLIDDHRKLPLLRCPEGVVGADATTTVLRMVGSPPKMMDGLSNRPIVVGEFVHGSSPSRQHLVVDIDTWRRRRRRDAMTTALMMVGSPPPMMDGPSNLGGKVCPWVLPIVAALSC